MHVGQGMPNKVSYWPPDMIDHRTLDDINFLAWMHKINHKFVRIANYVIHPWPQVKLIFDREMPPGFTPAICLRRNFVYISTLEDRWDKFVG